MSVDGITQEEKLPDSGLFRDMSLGDLPSPAFGDLATAGIVAAGLQGRECLDKGFVLICEAFPCFLDSRKYDFEIDFSFAVSVCPCLIF